MRGFASGFVGGVLSLAVVLVAYLILAVPHFAAEEMQSTAPFTIARAFSRVRLGALNQQILRPTRPFTSHFTTQRAFTTSSKMGYENTTFVDAVHNRRTIYGLDKNVTTTTDAKIKEIVEKIVRDVPSAFNSQSARLVVLFKDEHDKFWEIVTGILKAHVPEDKWEHTGQRMDMFKKGYGTVLFYEDPEPIKALQTKFPNYADKFPQWSEHTSAMHQFAMWTALEAEGLGANLQHYNPLPDQKASETWNIPLEWSLKAQLVFGNPVDAKRENLSEKSFEPIEKRIKFYGA